MEKVIILIVIEVLMVIVILIVLIRDFVLSTFDNKFHISPYIHNEFF